jgi:hypothetical protein
MKLCGNVYAKVDLQNLTFKKLKKIGCYRIIDVYFYCIVLKLIAPNK